MTPENIGQLIERDMETAELTQPVCVFTLDKAMQNVALQLKLPLAAPSGRRISRITRYALKCPACMAVFVSMEPLISYAQNKPFLAQLLNDSYKPAQLYCSQCGSPRLMRVAAFFTERGVSFSKGIKHFHWSGQENYCDVAAKRFASLRQKYLLHPELYHDRLVRVRTERSRTKQGGFLDSV